MAITGDQVEVLRTAAATHAPTVKPDPTAPSNNSGSGSGNALAALIYALQQLVMTFTGTMQVFQERFQQLSDQQSKLAAYLQQIPINNNDNQTFEKEVMEYKQQLNSVQNQQQLASVAMQGASSNESTMLAMLGNVVKIYGGALNAVTQSMGN